MVDPTAVRQPSPVPELFQASPVALLHVRGDTVVGSNDAAQALFRAGAPLAGLTVAELFAGEGTLTGRVLAVRRDGVRALVEVQFAPLCGNETVLFLRPLAGDSDTLASRLNEITRKVQSTRSVDALLDAVGEGLRSVGFLCGVVRLVGDQLVIRAIGAPTPRRLQMEAALERSLEGIAAPLGALPLYQAVIAERRSRFVPDIAALDEGFYRAFSPAAAERLGPAFAALDGCGGFLVPLLVEGAAWGVLALSSPLARPEDVDTLSLFGGQLGASMELAVSMDALERRNRQLSAINAVTRVAHGSFNGFASELCRIAAEGTGSDSGAIFLPAGDEGMLGLAGAHGYSSEDEKAFGRLPIDSSMTGKVFTSGDSKVMRLADWPDHCRGALAAAGAQEMATVPLRVQGRSIGALTLRRRRPLPYAAQDLAEAEMLGAQIAVQLENARLYGETARRLQVLSALFTISRTGTQTFDLRAVIDAALEKVQEVLEAQVTTVHLVGPGGLVLASNDRGALGPAALREALAVLPIDEGSLSGRAALTREAVTVDGGAFPSHTREAALGAGLRVAAAVPLLSGERVLGTLCVSRSSERRFTAEDLQLLWTCASYVSVAVEYLRLFEDERRRTDELKRLQEQLVRRERLAALGELAAVVAHEVRNPLGVIFNSLSALRRARQTGAARDSEMLLDIVGEEAERLNSIVGDLLDFARPIEPQLREESLALILNGAVEVAAGAAGTRGEDVKVVLSDAVRAVPADARMLRQAFINLLMNAFQATPKGGRILVRTALEDRGEAHFARVEVSDCGPGIAPELLPQIFQPFFTTKATGTGLGLAVVKRIVDAHHGEISVRSEGGGTTFTVRLPLRPGSPSQDPGAAAPRA